MIMYLSHMTIGLGVMYKIYLFHSIKGLAEAEVDKVYACMITTESFSKNKIMEYIDEDLEISIADIVSFELILTEHTALVE